MTLLYEVALLVFGVVILSKSSHWTIDSTVEITKITKLRELVIGFLLISTVSSLPELTVSITSILNGNSAISIGNILGSNVTNITLIIGLMAIVKDLKFKKKTYRELSVILLLSSLIPLVLLNLSTAHALLGYVLLGIFALFVFFSLNRRIDPRGMVEKPERTKWWEVLKSIELYKALLFVIFGVLGVIVSSKIIVDSASSIALEVGISETVIGATIVAIGTSLPELSIGLTSVRKNHIDLALGEVIGSSLTNLTLVFGLVLALSPFHVNMDLFTTVLSFNIFANLVLWFFLDKEEITHTEGLFLFVIYLAFLMVTFGMQMFSVG
jgi:cation:H+ antiporter